ncbi:response regulator containing a CheY-like receiver domain and an HTH DNA-binding domain [Frankia sp. EI5c]|uniref:response regulator transcription factor n=1 Tax=Frankia sp. EI5c TaxID=683316 RepID=UPI0007C365C3|nr:response regulator transcription factor [Frankia sp. EI5c]OAA29196.1 response regulator containing a CheY-like receiver domain and an HTH DNA-binding domain [Frankia sp. EI5c]
MRVAVAEDAALFREGLVLLLTTAGHEVVAAAPDGDRLLALLARDPVDVAILDIRMPPGDEGGLTTARRVRELHPGTGLLLLSHHAEGHYLNRLLTLGTERVGYRLKDRVAGLQVLTDTISRIAAGELVIEPVLARQLVERRTPRARPLAALTERELDVLRLMAEGRSNTGIAAALVLSGKAVEKHIAGIFQKLGLPPDSTAHHRRVLAVLTYLGVGAS